MGKININKLSGLDPIRVDNQREVKHAGKEVGLNVGKGAPVSEDKLEISSRASEVGNLVEQLKSLPDVRQNKVNALREQIAAGSYKPSGDSIADAILKDASA